MKKYVRNILLVALCCFTLLTFVACDIPTEKTYKEETEVQATVTYVLKTYQYVKYAGGLYTVRYDVSVDGVTKTFVQTQYGLYPQAWYLEEGDAVNCTMITTYSSEGEVISKKLTD